MLSARQTDAADYAAANIAYWTNRAPGYGDVNRAELATGQRLVWSETLDGLIRAHFRAWARGEIRILDLGTGPGFFAIILTEMGYRVTAIDYTEAMLAQARRNAGGLAARIDFRRMDAASPSFFGETFDVLVARNLTWNLPDPAAAYGEWARLLRPGGLMLNFDANWYRYLFDASAAAGHRNDRENVSHGGADDDTAGTDVGAMEAIARRAPLSSRLRPQWDLEILRGLGLSATADVRVWKRVWTENERINNASTPMFLVRAVKPEARR